MLIDIFKLHIETIKKYIPKKTETTKLSFFCIPKTVSNDSIKDYRKFTNGFLTMAKTLLKSTDSKATRRTTVIHEEQLLIPASIGRSDKNQDDMAQSFILALRKTFAYLKGQNKGGEWIAKINAYLSTLEFEGEQTISIAEQDYITQFEKLLGLKLGTIKYFNLFTQASTSQPIAYQSLTDDILIKPSEKLDSSFIPSPRFNEIDDDDLDSEGLANSFIPEDPILKSSFNKTSIN